MLPWLGLALILLIADQFTKMLILGYYQLGDSTTSPASSTSCGPTTPARRSRSWPTASGWQRWLFTGIGVAAAVFIVWMLRSARRPEAVLASRWPASWAARSGNVIDRLMHGYVVDFLQFHWAGWYFPAFNVADSAITIGAVCLVLDELLRVRRDGASRAAARATAAASGAYRRMLQA